MIQIRQHGVAVDSSKLDELRAEFAERHCLLMRQVLEPALLSRLLPLLDDTPVYERTPGAAQGKIIARELCADRDSVVMRAFSMLLNNPAIFRAVEQITGCPTIAVFQGRVYMMRPDAGHYDTWHSDNDGNRLIGLSLNLSPDYSGGAFQIREHEQTRILAEIHNVVPGDAHLFRIASNLQHCVSPVTGTTTKAAYAGWFQLRGEPPVVPR